jgi:hypothetical protein
VAYYTINQFYIGRTIQSSDVTDYVQTDADARALFASVCAAQRPHFAELAVDTGTARSYRVVAHFDRYGMHDGDAA